MKTPKEIVGIMMEKDSFSQWMNLNVLSINKGNCVLECTIHEDMLNGFGIAHGGISYSLSDSALAFSSNAYGYQCVSIETSISHIRPVFVNDVLTVKSEEIHRGKTIGIYTIEIKNQDLKLISKFKGTVNISQNMW
jgi:acyl-CoA thioesterase